MTPLASFHRSLHCLLLGLALLAAAAAASGQCMDKTKKCGRQAFDAGVEAFQAGNYEKAVERFRHAYSIAKIPVITFNLALAEDKLGQTQAALDHLDEVLDDSSISAALKEKAASERARIARNLAVLVVDLPGSAKTVVEVDGSPRTLTDGALRVTPGKHRVRVVENGVERMDRDIRVDAGERLVLHFERTREVLVGPAPAPGPAAPSERDGPSSGGVSPTWFYVSAGATVLLTGAAVWSGLDTLSAKDDLDQDRPNLTLAEEQARLDDGHAKERRTNVLIAVAGAAAVGTAALGLFAVHWGDDQAALQVAPTGVRLSGRF